jgi:AraC-like DNA-binding protein
VASPTEDTNRRLLRARDAMDRAYAQPLDVPALARIAHVSEAHFIRTFRATFGETPTAYRRRAGPLAVPTCFTMTWTRPSSFGEAAGGERG